MIESGFVVCGELGGPPAPTGSGYGHGFRNRTALLRAVAERLEPGLRVETIAGNRMLATAPDGSLPKAALLLDLMEAAYITFRDARIQILDTRLCSCDGCLGTAAVTLRLVAHHGRWSREKSGDRTRCTGPDVSLTERLLEDPVLAAGGALLLTDAALHRTEIDRDAAGLGPYDREQEGIGRVTGATLDLELVWERDARSNVRVDPKEAAATLEVTLPVPETIAWDWLTAPDKRTLWEEVDSIESSPRPDRRAGAGTRYRSLHGKHLDEVREVLDWKPFRYWTWDVRSRGRRVRATVELSPVEGGTRVVSTLGVPKGCGPIERFRTRVAIRSRVAPDRSAALERLRALLEVERRLEGRRS